MSDAWNILELKFRHFGGTDKPFEKRSPYQPTINKTSILKAKANFHAREICVILLNWGASEKKFLSPLLNTLARLTKKWIKTR
jgi:hypothetical protein